MLGMAVSDTTIVRILKAIETMPCVTPKILGVDDWSIQKGQTYGAILAAAAQLIWKNINLSNYFLIVKLKH